jgi:hypothetical protein
MTLHMPEYDYNETIVMESLKDLSLRERCILAHMNEVDVEIFQAILDRHIKGKGSRIADGKNIVNRIWAKLHGNHWLRVVGTAE